MQWADKFQCDVCIRLTLQYHQRSSHFCVCAVCPLINSLIFYFLCVRFCHFLEFDVSFLEYSLDYTLEFYLLPLFNTSCINMTDSVVVVLFRIILLNVLYAGVCLLHFFLFFFFFLFVFSF